MSVERQPIVRPLTSDTPYVRMSFHRGHVDNGISKKSIEEIVWDASNRIDLDLVMVTSMSVTEDSTLIYVLSGNTSSIIEAITAIYWALTGETPEIKERYLFSNDESGEPMVIRQDDINKNIAKTLYLSYRQIRFYEHFIESLDDDEMLWRNLNDEIAFTFSYTEMVSRPERETDLESIYLERAIHQLAVKSKVIKAGNIGGAYTGTVENVGKFLVEASTRIKRVLSFDLDNIQIKRSSARHVIASTECSVVQEGTHFTFVIKHKTK